MAGPRKRLGPWLSAVALIVGGLLPASRADEPLRLGAVAAPAAKPLLFAADEVHSWSEAGEQVILLKGNVLLEQGVVSVRAARAVLWLDEAAQRSAGAYRIRVAAEGKVAFEDGPKRQTGPSATLEIESRPGPKPKPGVRVVLKPQGTDPFFRRALDARAAAADAVRLAAAVAPPGAGDAATSPFANPLPAGAPPQPQEFPAPGTPLPAIPVPGGQTITPTLPADPAAPAAPPRSLLITPRGGASFRTEGFRQPSGEQGVIFNGGVIVTIRNVQSVGLIDIEADRLVVWSRGDAQQFAQRMQGTGAQSDQAQETEFYFAGNVQIRQASGKDAVLLQAEQVYYDVRRHVAVAVGADLELRRAGMPEPLHMKADELFQLSPTRFEAVQAQVFSSKLPSDPGLKVVFARATIEQKTIERRGLLGQPVLDRVTGQPQSVDQRLVRGENVVLQVEDVPIFYLPVVQGDANDPLGPLESVSFKQDRIFGTQVYSTFDVWNLLRRDPLPGTRWTADLAYLSRRGPAAGTTFDYGGQDLFGLSGPFAGNVRLFGLYDEGGDILGGGRGELDEHPDWRGRVYWRHSQKAFDDVTLQTQLSLLSDKNFLEQYFKQEFDTAYNQETFVYLKRQRDITSAALLLKPNLRDWVTEDVWLPRVDAAVLGKSFLDVLTYNVRANAGYAELRPTQVPPFPSPLMMPTDRRAETGRFDVIQDVSLPFYLGPVRVVPYGVLDTAYYTDDLSGDSNGRVYGGGGVRTSLPFSRLYPNVRSERFNLNGIYHKVVFGGNYFIADSSDPFTDFPQLDRLNDDATDQALRDITPRQPFLNPANGTLLATSPQFNPQLYAIRRLVDNRIDTLDTIEVFQADVRQRWQTKRGFPGQEHVIDYLTLDLSASFFPHPDRDNFGKSVAFLEYDTTWNVGDRTAVVSSGWFDPFPDGARVITLGTFLNRPDRTNFFLGYRFIDPIDSRAFTAAATYIFSPKYAMTSSLTYDFGSNEALSNSMVITRMGTDLTVSVGFTYNALLNNFGFTFEVLPNVVALNRRGGGGPFSRSSLLR